jgi:hypothetical protein
MRGIFLEFTQFTFLEAVSRLNSLELQSVLGLNPASMKVLAANWVSPFLSVLIITELRGTARRNVKIFADEISIRRNVPCTRHNFGLSKSIRRPLSHRERRL